ncbi:hypothetical protein SAMD00019534_070570, partial [Acytostelium subglobosum LB1]|uniref:hypothetical protein n=1 Tax=Acytostelium subglobosum LB1 TaxID=1410327 RepID=UPI000644FC10
GSKVSKLLEDAQKNHSKEINLKGTNLKHLPMVICTNFLYITKLNINDNQIKEIPIDIYKLRSLRVLWAVNNRLTFIPGEIGLLTDLEDLQVDGNSIVRVDTTFFELRKITELSLARNSLRDVPSDMGQLISLRSLTLEHNQITALPGSLSGMSSLRSLNAANNEIEYIFADFVNMSQLTSLCLSSNRLTTLPDSFGRLKTLVSLNLRSNRLATLPLSFGQLENLASLHLWDNNFTVFPVSLTKCVSLTELNMSNNKLADVPPEIAGLVNLQKLYLQYNEIEHLPVDIKYLSKLNHLLLHHNRLAALPAEISQIKTIESINLTGNPLPARLLQADLATLLKILHGDFLNRRDSSARVIQRHYRAWKRQYRFRTVVLLLMEKRNHDRSVSHASQRAAYHRAAIVIQRFYRACRIRKTWRNLVAQVMLLQRTSSLVASTGGEASLNASCARFSSIFGFNEPDQNKNIVFYLPDNATAPVIKSATLAKLVEHLTYTTYTEVNYPRTFFATYTSFVTPIELFQLLCVRYHIEPPQNVTPEELATFRKTVKPRIQERVIEMMGFWIKNHLNDFEEDAKLLQNFNSFLTNTLMLEQETSAKRLIAIFNESKKKYLEDVEELVKLVESAPKPILPMRLASERLTFMDLSPIEVARQMALIDQNLLHRISAKELLSKKWSNPDLCPNILNMIRIFNNGSQWITSEIVSEKSSKHRLKKLKFFLEVARLCFDMCNFNGLMQIVSGLSSSAVSRLRGTWGALSSRRREQFDEMERIVNMEGNFRQYRICLADAKGACIPFVGLYLMDLTFIDEGNPTLVDGNLLNFVKKRIEANAVNKFLSYRQTPYCFEPVPFIQDLLLNSPTLTESEQYERSSAIEKRHMRKLNKRLDRERQLTATSDSTEDLGGVANIVSDDNLTDNEDAPPISLSGEHFTSSPALMISPNKNSKVPSLDFVQPLSPSKITSLYHSMDNGSPRFSPAFKSSPRSDSNILTVNNLALSTASPPPSRSTKSPMESPRSGYDSSPPDSPYRERR